MVPHPSKASASGSTPAQLDFPAKPVHSSLFILWQTPLPTHALHSEGFLRCLWCQPLGPSQLHLGVTGKVSTVLCPCPTVALSPCTAQPQPGFEPGSPPWPRLVPPSVTYTEVFKVDSLKTDLCSGSLQGRLVGDGGCLRNLFH